MVAPFDPILVILFVIHPFLALMFAFFSSGQEKPERGSPPAATYSSKQSTVRKDSPCAQGEACAGSVWKLFHSPSSLKQPPAGATAATPVLYEKFAVKGTALTAGDEAILGSVQNLLTSITDTPKTGVAAFGLRGHGKSSCMNLVQSCLRKRMWRTAASGNTGSTITTSWNSHHLTTEDGTALPWWWVDTPGDDVKMLVDVWKVHDGPVSKSMLNRELQDKEELLDRKLIQPCLDNGVGCIMLVVSAESLMEDSYHLTVYRQVHQRALHQGLNCICIITKVDLVDAEVADNIASICHSEVVDNLRNKVADTVGMNKNQVHPVVNFTKEMEPQDNPRKCMLGLNAIYHALGDSLASQSAQKEDIGTLVSKK